MMQPRILCLGEALIDIVEKDGKSSEHVGGSPLNVAAGLARLGHETTIRSWFGNDDRGRRIKQSIAALGVELADGSDRAARTPTALAKLDEFGHATYTFDLDWQVPELPDVEQFDHLHIGSFSATLEPGATAVLEAARRMRGHGTVSYDPNARPALMGEPADVLGRIEELISLSDVVKASDEDLEWFYGKQPLEDVMRRWRSLGPAMVVVTRGPWGAMAALTGDRDRLALDQINVEVADSVGAGDSFMAGMISGLCGAGLLGSREAGQRLREARWPDVQAALHRAVATSAVTVSRVGAYAPDRDETTTMLERA